jgi:hypothetical protein
LPSIAANSELNHSLLGMPRDPASAGLAARNLATQRASSQVRARAGRRAMRYANINRSAPVCIRIKRMALRLVHDGAVLSLLWPSAQLRMRHTSARRVRKKRKKFPISQQNFGNPKLLRCNLSPTMSPVKF